MKIPHNKKLDKSLQDIVLPVIKMQFKWLTNGHRLSDWLQQQPDENDFKIIKQALRDKNK